MIFLQAFKKARLLFFTVKHLKPVQFYGRLFRRLFRVRPELLPAPGLANQCTDWVEGARRSVRMHAADKVVFLNHSVDIKEHSCWNDPSQSKLWLYNLHYFDDLNAHNAAERIDWHRQLIQRWIEENPPGFGNGWEPYPTSLRIINWTKWALNGNILQPEWLHSLAVQTRWLRKHLEWHLLGNHLFVNAKALIIAGLFFEGPEADRWFNKGMDIIVRELPEQVLADGGHFERSTMYHALALEDLLDLINITTVHSSIPERWQSFISTWPAIAARMWAWLAGMCHPDGEIAFFNDAALDIAPSPQELKKFADKLGLTTTVAPHNGLTHLVESGYVRLQGDKAVAILDVAPVGPDYLLGHAHADTLSFELSLQGQRLVVNSGTSVYGSNAERHRQRGTAAHSTVEIDAENSSEVWAGFRVARRAYPFGLKIEENADFISVRCAHDGYRRLPGKPIHRRSWQMTDKYLRVSDNIEGLFHKGIARFHFHPDVQALFGDSPENGTLRQGGKQIASWRVVKGKARLVPGTYHPGFGRSVANQCLEVTLSKSSSEVEFFWD